MTIFYRHDIIYQHLTTGWYDIALEESGWDQAPPPPVVPPVKVPPSTTVGDLFQAAAPVVEDPGWDQAPPPPIVRRIPVFYSDLNNPVPDDIPVSEPGWDQAFLPPLVVHPPRFLPRTEEVLDEITFDLQEPGWHQAFLPPVVRRIPVFYGDWVIGDEIPVEGGGSVDQQLVIFMYPIIYQHLTTGWDEIPLQEPGWDQAPPPPVVRRKDVFFPRTEEVLDEIAVQQPGWDQAFLPPLVVYKPVFFPRTEEVLDEITFDLEEPGWHQAFLPPLVLRPFAPTSTSVADLFSVVAPVVEDPGWEQAPPPPVVRRIPVFYSDWVIGEEIALEEPGWHQAFLPPLVLPRDQAFFLPSENNPVMGPTTIELIYTLDAILGPLAPPGLRLKELRLKELRLKELRRRFIRRD